MRDSTFPSSVEQGQQTHGFDCQSKLLRFNLCLRLQRFLRFGVEMQFVLQELRTPRRIPRQRVAIIDALISLALTLEREQGEEAGADEQGLARAASA